MHVEVPDVPESRILTYSNLNSHNALPKSEPSKPVKPCKIEAQADPEDLVQRIKKGDKPDERWVLIAALYISLQTEWGFKHFWSKKKYQKILREAQSINLQAGASLLAHRIIVETLAGKKLDSVWRQLQNKAREQARKWINSSVPIPQWMHQTVSILWGTDKTWNKGHIVEVAEPEMSVSYVSDYTEVLTASDTTFRFEPHAPQDWWIGKTLDVKWDGAHEWYEATIEEVNGQEIIVRYGDQSTEKLIMNQQISYFALDRVKNLYEKTQEMFKTYQTPPAVVIPTNPAPQTAAKPLSNPPSFEKVDVDVKMEPFVKTEATGTAV